MAGNKRNKKSNFRPQATASTSAAVGIKSVQLTEEEQKLLELAKKVAQDDEMDLAEFRGLLDEDYVNEYEQKKAEMLASLEEEKAKLKQEFESQLRKDNDELIQQNDELKKANEKIEKEVGSLEKKVEKVKEQKETIIDKAKEEAAEIVEKAEEEASKENQKTLEEIEAQKRVLEEEKEELEDKELELESKEALLASKERRLGKQAAIYDTANPDAVASLERQLKMRSEQLEAIQSEYEEAQKELNKIRISMIHAKGISPEELQKINEQLYKRIEELENKCNRYTEEELNEMKAAFDAKDSWLTQIRNLTNEVSSNRLELTRVNNSIQEYEQLKAQMDLLRTLNEHLRAELDNTKRMLESSVGEICPALTSIDIDESVESGDSFIRYEERMSKPNNGELTTLFQIVEHVKKYAASQEKPLFYTDKDLRAFISGMAASPLAILQGMSGTGKTSLPKIFTKAILGEINVVPVESSWRDRNELLGYYNDFSKKFTAKEFTCDLYRAGCQRYDDTIYFIVLDEMNLSRIEYYFADFLSVLEDEKSKWLIKLVDTDMRQLPTEITDEVIKALAKDKSKEGLELQDIVEKLYPNSTLTGENESAVSGSDKLKLITYLSNKKLKNKTKTRSIIGGPQNLINGNTIHIPKNVWFVGTANRDESTFEITDKVYDRAQVLNFDSRAKGKRIDEDIPAVYITYGDLQAMFVKAKNSKSCAFDAESCTALKEIESVLKSYFRISYGNRIQDQMNIFVPVYVAAGSYEKSKPEELKKLENEAIDYQLTNKVLRKLEYEDINKEAADKLRKLFEKYGLEKARDFINWKTRGEEI